MRQIISRLNRENKRLNRLAGEDIHPELPKMEWKGVEGVYIEWSVVELNRSKHWMPAETYEQARALSPYPNSLVR